MRLTRYDAEHLPASAAPLYQDMAADWLDLEDECQRLREERNGFFIGMMEEKARAEQAEAERERYREALETASQLFYAGELTSACSVIRAALGAEE